MVWCGGGNRPGYVGVEVCGNSNGVDAGAKSGAEVALL